MVPQETRIPVPSFAKHHQRKRREWNKPVDTMAQIQKFDALNLEMSQSFKAGQLPLIHNQIISKGTLLDSLDLNTGYDAIEKAKERNINLRKVTKGPTDYKPKIQAPIKKFT
jgi:hypothetical protein